MFKRPLCVTLPRLPKTIMQKRWWLKQKFRNGHSGENWDIEIHICYWEKAKRSMGRKKGWSWTLQSSSNVFIISERSHWLLSPCQCQDGGGRVAGQLQAKPRGGAAGARQLHCAVLWMQRSEVRGEPTRSGLGGSKFKRLSFQFQFRQWSAVDYWYPCTVTMRCRGAVLIIGLLTTHHINILWEWGENEKESCTRVK